MEDTINRNQIKNPVGDDVVNDASRGVIVGGGFGGLATTKALRYTPVHVSLIDRTNHHLFQPLLYQVATSVLAPGQIASPIWTYMTGQRGSRLIVNHHASESVSARPPQPPTNQPGQAVIA